mgnify:CR=1 FL=1
MSKAERIRDLLATTDKTRAEIAADVGCLQEYVRVVEQRLLRIGGQSPEQRWVQRNPGKALEAQASYKRRRYARDPAYRAKKVEQNRKWRERNTDYYRAHQREYARRKESQSNG